MLIDLMREIGIPSVASAVGCGEGDVPALVPGTMKQQRLTATCPREAGEEEARRILVDSVEIW